MWLLPGGLGLWSASKKAALLSGCTARALLPWWGPGQPLGRAFLLLPPLRYILFGLFCCSDFGSALVLPPKWTLMHPRLPQHLPLARSFSQPIYKVIFTTKMLQKWGRATKSISPSPSSLSFPTVGWQMGFLSPQPLPMSWEHLKLLRPSVSRAVFSLVLGAWIPDWFWEFEDPILPLRRWGRER